MDDNKKEFFKNKKLWKSNLEIILEKEGEYKERLVNKFADCIVTVKNEIIHYCNVNEYTSVVRTKFIEAKIDEELLFRVNFYDPKARDKYEFELVITEDSRREYLIIIKPFNHCLYIPKLVNSANRPRPKNITECKRYIKDLGEEYSFLEENIKKLEDIEFKFCFYASNKKNPEIENLKLHDNFILILTSLLS